MNMAGFQEEDYIAVVAIDFGTSFSGFAFAFNHSDGESGIHMNKAWGYDFACPNNKAPTCLLLKPDMTFDSFGYEAQDKFARLKDAKQFHYFERFKMVLHGNKFLNRETTIKAKNGKSFPAKKVFALSIAYLKDKALEILKERTDTEYTAKDIKWVITVPAIWKAPAKQFMREAAENAEIIAKENPDQLIIALEPEAAGIYCRQLKMREFVKEREDDYMEDTVSKMTTYLVCDIGGGTLDMTAYEIIENDNIKEIHHATGGAFGGIKVDAEFEKLMEVNFGKDLMDEFRNKYPSDWLETMTDWEMKKRSSRAVQNEVTRVKVSYNFMKFYEQHQNSGRKKKFPLKWFTRPKQRPVPNNLNELSLSNGYLWLDPTVMKALFKEVISSIVCEIKKVLKKSNLANKINCIFLVGGFSDCTLLQEAVREAFEAPMYRVLVPEEAYLAVVKGAVMFGQKPNIVTERALAETYGTDVCKPFEECDPQEKCVVVEGVRKCNDRFRLLATVGEVVKVGECRTSIFYPLRRDQTQATFKFFTTERLDIPRYTDEDGVKELQCHVRIDCPIRPEKKDRALELKMYFGGTEIQVIATDLKSGKGVSAYIDFLTK